MQVFLKVQLPAALPFIFTGAKVAITLAVIGAVIGEFVPGRYRPVRAEAVARSLVTAARIDAPGLHIIESEEIREGVDPSRAGEVPA
jgi:hypothetical protein